MEVVRANGVEIAYERVGKGPLLVFVHGAAEDGRVWRPHWKGSLPEEEVRARVEGARRMLEAPAEQFDPTLRGLFAGDPPAEFVALLEQIAADVRPDSLRTQLSVMAKADQRDLLSRIAVPALLIWGELDARSPLRVARQFEQAIPEAKLVVIPGCGHVSHLEQPEQFNQAVREFCRAQRPRGS